MGNTPKTALSNGALPVNPHVRGEHAQADKAAVTTARLIPTFVGNTDKCFTDQEDLAVNPHVRGEHEVLADEWFRSSG